jgi:hypothetical protein
LIMRRCISFNLHCNSSYIIKWTKVYICFCFRRTKNHFRFQKLVFSTKTDIQSEIICFSFWFSYVYFILGGGHYFFLLVFICFCFLLCFVLFVLFWFCVFFSCGLYRYIVLTLKKKKSKAKKFYLKSVH